MENIVFIRISDGYWPIKSISLEGDILTNFLISDVGSDVPDWIEWLEGNKDAHIRNNATNTFEDPDNPDEILINDALSDGEPFVVIKRQKLIELLKSWQQLNKQRPHYIVITRDGDDISMHGESHIDIPHQFATFRSYDGSYVQTRFEGPLGWIVGVFLTKDVRDNASPWIEWLDNPQEHEIIESKKIRTRLIKNADEILLGDILTEDGPNFPLKKDMLVEVLKK